jgi:drug/metabolite transporter (DMT)-like permease
VSCHQGAGVPASGHAQKTTVAMRPALIPLLLALAWGLNWPAVKIMLSVLPPFSARALGLGLGALLLLALALLRGARLLPQRAAWPAVAVGSLLTVAVFNLCTAFAQLTTSTSRAAVLTFTMPLMSAALAWCVLGERPGRRGAAALALGGVGVALLAVPVLQGLAGSAPGASVWGLVFPLAAALAWAGGTVATKRWPPPGDRIVLTAWQLGLGALIAAFVGQFASEQLPAVWPAKVVVALVWHVLMATALAYVMWYRLLASASATVSSLTTLAVPVVGVLGAMALVGDRPSGVDWLGFCFVLGGAALAVLGLGARPAAPASAASAAGAGGTTRPD